MTEWSLPRILAGLHNEIERKLGFAREAMGHPVSKGDASEGVWIDLLSDYLPTRYKAAKVTVVDSKGQFSQQIDVAIYDRQYSPLVMTFQGETVIPAESIYAVFEAKQTVNAAIVNYAHEKVASVRKLHRTSMPIPTANGPAAPKPPPRILGGLLAFESDWSPAMGDTLVGYLGNASPEGRLDIGCIAAHGTFDLQPDQTLKLTPKGKPATAFLLELIARLQEMATVPMIDTRAYAAWLSQ